MDRKDRIIQTLSQQIAHSEVVKAELLAIIQELKEGEKDGDNSTELSEG